MPRTSVRIDTAAIFVLLPLLILQSGRIRFDRRCRPILAAFALLAVGVALAVFLQVLVLGKPHLPLYLKNVQGYLRPLLFGVLAAMAIRSGVSAERMARLILFATIVHGGIALIEFLNIQPVTALINLLYRGHVNARVGLRAIGAFDTVHSLAYFSLYALLFSSYVALYAREDRRLRRLALAACGAAFVGLILPFSRGAWIAAVAASAYLFLRKESIILVFKLALGLAAVSALSMAFLPEALERFMEYYDSLYNGVKFLLGSTDIVDENSIGFITGRLDWGWMNALRVWKENPLHGDLSYSLTSFIGDGGYTETLANHGLLGSAANLALFATLWKGVNPKLYDRLAEGQAVRKIMRTFVLAFIFASFATGLLKERTIELLPVMFVTMAMLPAGRGERAGSLPAGTPHPAGQEAPA